MMTHLQAARNWRIQQDNLWNFLPAAFRTGDPRSSLGCAAQAFTIDINGKDAQVLILVEDVAVDRARYYSAHILDVLRKRLTEPLQEPSHHFNHRKIQQHLLSAVRSANHESLYIGDNLTCNGDAGLMMVLVLLYDGGLYISHIGRNRAYRSRLLTWDNLNEENSMSDAAKGKHETFGDDLQSNPVGWQFLREYYPDSFVIERLTTDHTYAQQKIDKGLLSPEAGRTDPTRLVLLRRLGVSNALEVDMTVPPLGTKSSTHHLRQGDLIALCSSGITDALDESAIHQAIAGRSPFAASRRLVRQAARSGQAKDANLYALVFMASPTFHQWLWRVPDLMLQALSWIGHGVAWLISFNWLRRNWNSIPLGAVLSCVILSVLFGFTFLQFTLNIFPSLQGVVDKLCQWSVPLPQCPTIIPTATPETDNPLTPPSLSDPVSVATGPSDNLTGSVGLAPYSTVAPRFTPPLAPSPIPSDALTAPLLPIPSSVSSPAAATPTTDTPTSPDESIILLEPADGHAASGAVRFEWSFRPPLASGQTFEVIYWDIGQDPQRDGLGMYAPTTGSNITINLGQLDDQVEPPFEPGTHYWGVCLLGPGSTDPSKSVRLLCSTELRRFTYNREPGGTVPRRIK